MPDAGAGSISWSSFVSGGGGKYVCCPIFFDEAGGLGAVGGVVVLLIGFPAIAEVDRNTTGRRSSATRLAEAAGEPSGPVGLVTDQLLARTSS